MKKFFKYSKIEVAVAFLIFLINCLLKIPFTARGFFAITYDQGRDFLEVAKIIYGGNFTLIGPTTGLQGIFYGPWWYYFLSPILYVSKGDPQGVANVFGFLGIITAVLVYPFIKYLTDNTFVAVSLAFIASISSSWMFGPTMIWSPSLVPILMVFFIFIIDRIFTKPIPIYYLLLGIITFLIADSGAAFGIMLTLFLFLTPFIFRRSFFKKEFLLTILGALVITSPRVLFDFRNNFLISKSVLAYVSQPKIYGEQLSLTTRLVYRLDHFWGIFSDSFARGNKLLGGLIIIFLIFIIYTILKNKNISSKFKKDPIVLYLSLLLIFLLLAFTVFPGVVWGYYLVGLPIIFIVILSKIFTFAFRIGNLKIFAGAFLIALVILNFNTGLLSPFKITWGGDEATYRNQKKIVDYITSQAPSNYSFYAYTPAIFDYPFDYLIYWYSRQGLLEAPKDKQNIMYLVIREESSKKYLKSGWYGDKTRDKTVILERKEFPGDLVVEKHQFMN